MYGGNINIVGTYYEKISSSIKPHLAVIVLVIAVLIGNLFFTNIVFISATDANYSYSVVDPVQTAQFIRDAGEYTPLLDENADEYEFANLVDESDGFVSKEFGESTVITEIANKDFEYTVQKGETLSSIAGKFNLHVASLVQMNGIDVNRLENLKPGEKLMVPANDISDSKDWLVQLNAKKEEDRQIALKEEAARQKKLAATKQKSLASSKRSVVVRDRDGYSGVDSGSLNYTGSYNYVSRGYGSGHNGIDYVMGVGTPVAAAGSGRVVSITGGWGGGYGNSVLVDHGGGRTTRYAHLSQVNVGIGETVGGGETIGLSGNTGWSTGPHLHFEN